MISMNEHIALTHLKQEHLTSFFQLVSNPSITKYMRFSNASTIEEAQAILDMYINDVSFAIIEMEKKTMVGVFSLKRTDDASTYQLSVFLSPIAQGKGYMKSIFEHMVPYAKQELHAHVLEAYILDNNKHSCHLVESYGFHIIETIHLPNHQDTLFLYHKEL